MLKETEIKKEIRNPKFGTAVNSIDFRAERRESYLDVYEDTGYLQTMSNNSNQVVFGRRGSGKTHLLGSFKEYAEKNLPKTLVVYVDIREASQLYPTADLTEQPAKTKATSYFWLSVALIFTNIRLWLLEKIHSTGEYDKWGKGISTADDFFDAITAGLLSEQLGVFKLQKGSEPLGFSKPELKKPRRLTVTQYFESLLEEIGYDNLLIIIDEFSSLPQTVQPYYADAIKKALTTSHRVGVKLGTIRYRTNFLIEEESGDKYGLEVGADIFGDVDLDDINLWEKDQENSIKFYLNLLTKHINFELKKIEEDAEVLKTFSDPNNIIKIFASQSAFLELVRAGEGIPRDFLNVFKRAYRIFLADAESSSIRIKHIRKAALDWYEQDKISNIEKISKEYRLLVDIINEVIGKFNTKAFLMPSDITNDAGIQRLVDLRLLHIIHKGWSSKKYPGKRYDIFSLDYGNFIRLLDAGNAKNIQLKLYEEYLSKDSWPDDAPLPDLDLRSIRRRIYEPNEKFTN